MIKRITAPVLIVTAVAALLALGAIVVSAAYQHATEVRGIETGAYQTA